MGSEDWSLGSEDWLQSPADSELPFDDWTMSSQD